MEGKVHLHVLPMSNSHDRKRSGGVPKISKKKWWDCKIFLLLSYLIQENYWKVTGKIHYTFILKYIHTYRYIFIHIHTYLYTHTIFSIPHILRRACLHFPKKISITLSWYWQQIGRICQKTSVWRAFFLGYEEPTADFPKGLTYG